MLATVHAAGSVQYKVHSTLAGVRGLVPAWDRILETSACNRAFCSAEWYLGSCRTEKYRSFVPHTVVAFQNGEAIGILPLICDPERRIATIPHYCSDYTDVFVPRHRPELVADLIESALGNQDRFDRIVISRLAQDWNCVEALPLIAAKPGLACDAWETDRYRYVKLPASFDDYLASKSKNFRKSVRRVQRALEGAPLAMRELKPAAFAPAVLPQLLLSLAAARPGEEFVQRTARIKGFMEEVLPLVFAKRRLRAFAILDEDRVLALDLCMVSATGLATWNGGFLPEAEAWSPGALLTRYGMTRAIEAGLEEYDFLSGDEDYKKRWATDEHVVGEAQIRTTWR